ncbi:hypothetical protein CaCOL14_004445 [Colletotrichum acutatum]
MGVRNLQNHLAGREFDLLQPGGPLEKMRGYGFWEDAIDYTKAMNQKTDYTNAVHQIVEERAIEHNSRFTLLLPPSIAGAAEQPHQMDDRNTDVDQEPATGTDGLAETHISTDNSNANEEMGHGNDVIPEGRKIKVCRRIGDSETWVRFVPADAPPLTFSSTLIRRILEGGFLKKGNLAGTSWARSMLEDEALDSVKGMVLYPEVLARIMLQRHGIARLGEA